MKIKKNSFTAAIILLSMLALVMALPNIDFVGDTPAHLEELFINNFIVNISTNVTGDSYTFVSLDNDKIFWFSMNQSAASTVYDESDNSVLGTLNAGVIINSTGHFTSAAWFDGLNDYISGSGSFVPEFNRGTAITDTTLSAWIYPMGANTYNGFEGVIAVMGTGEQNPQVEILMNQTGDGVRCGSAISGGQRSAFTNFEPVPLNQWSHVACTFELVGNVYNATLYIDGTEVDADSKTITTSPYTYQFTSNLIHIGAQKRGGFARWFKGGIDDAIFINRSLASEEIQSLYNSSAYPYYHNFTGLSNGNHTIKGYVTDSTGDWNVTSSRKIIINYDTNAPTLSLNKSLDIVNIATNDDINITWSAVDDLNDVDTAYLNVTFPNGTLVYSSNSNNGSIILNAPNNLSAVGTYTINFQANDTFGNFGSTSDTFEVVDTADEDAPTIDFVGETPQDGAVRGSLVVNISSTDASDHYAFLDLDSDVIFWMRFDDLNASGDPIDLSAQSNNGTKFADVNFSETGQWGNASWFDGSGDKVLPKTDIGFQPTGTYTWSFWIYPTYSSGQHAIWGDSGGFAANGWAFTLNPNGNDHLYFTNGGQLEEIDSGYTVPKNQWTHIVYTFDGTYGAHSYNGNLTWYINGEFYGSDTTSYYEETFGTFGIGYTVGTNNYYYYQGGIDDILIFNRTLTSEEIGALYSAEATQYYGDFQDLSDGTYTLTGHAVDMNGNRNQTGDRNVDIDNTPPSINFSLPTPANGSAHSGNDFTINFTTSDAHDHYSFVDLNNDVLLWMRFDDLNASGDPIDLSGNGNNGSILNDVTITNYGKWGDYAYLEGNGDSIEVPDNDYTDLHPNATISIWAKADSDVDYYDAIIMKSANGNWNNGYGIWYKDTTEVCFWFGSYGESAADCAEGLSADEWTHYAMVVNDTTAAFYVNGVLEQTDSASYIDSGTNNLHIGSGEQTTFYSFDGSVDDVIIFNRTLSQTEVQALYNASAIQFSKDISPQDIDYNLRGYSVDVVHNENDTTRVIYKDTCIYHGESDYLIQCSDSCESNSFTMTEGAVITINGSSGYWKINDGETVSNVRTVKNKNYCTIKTGLQTPFKFDLA